MTRSWDVFCRVVDNYGDAAVCWRLARELAARSGSAGKAQRRPVANGTLAYGDGAVPNCTVRLWLDDLSVLHDLCPRVDASLAQQSVDGVDILRWDTLTGIDPMSAGLPADIVVEGFGCGLPDAYALAMAQRSPASLWITLEYLSAEPWVASHHRLPSPHPRLALQRYFFFPGFTADTGGLVKEDGLDARRDAFLANPDARNAFWRRSGFAPLPDGAFSVSLFGYDHENAAVASLLGAWSAAGKGGQAVVVGVPPGRLRPQVLEYFNAPGAVDGDVLHMGDLEARLLPFLEQDRYDELLWSCDWNFVRGEDSFVRAQWAAQPFAWHIYPQADDAHWAKLTAFLDLWCAGLDAGAAQAMRGFWLAWNGRGDCGAAWERVMRHRETLTAHARQWPKALDLAGNLAEKLAQFCEDRLKSPAS